MISRDIATACGSNKIVRLNHTYDINQMWFDFGHVTIFEASTSTKALTAKEKRAEINKAKSEARNANNKLASMKTKINKKIKLSPEHHSLYPNIGLDQNQYLLPFDTGRRLSTKVITNMSIVGFPLFEKDENGNYYGISFKSVDGGASRLFSICDRVCYGKYGSLKSQKTVVFEKYSDMIMVKIAL